VCATPQPATVLGQPALRLDCTGRVGGWPHVALVTRLEGRTWLADGVVSALPAMQQSIAVLSGRATARTVSGDAVNALLAERHGEQARAGGDVREFDVLMQQGRRANLADNPVAAESAYGAAVALQEKAFGRDTPNAADALLHLALQLSNEGRIAEADTAFTRAARLMPRVRNDPTIRPRLLHFQGMHELNQGHSEAALGMLRQAEAGYAATIPADGVRGLGKGAQSQGNLAGKVEGNAGGNVGGSMTATLSAALSTPADQEVQMAQVGVVETRRYQAVVLRQMGRTAESEAKMRSAAEMARDAQLTQPALTARLRRSAGLSASLAGDSSRALSDFGESDAAFGRAYPGSRPLALVELLRARELVRAGRTDAAAEVCRGAVKTLVEIKSGFEPERMAPCLDAFGAAAAASSGMTQQAVLRDMFRAAQVVRSTQTEQQINQSAARLGESSRDTRVGQAIRQQQDASVALATIRRQRETALQAGRAGAAPATAALDEQEQAAIRTLADRESDLQAAAPNFGQLLQQVTAAEDILRLLRPGEAFAEITLTADGGWIFLLHDGAVQVGRIPGGSVVVDPLVRRIRAAMTAATPAFDTTASETLYKTLFGGLPGGLEGVRALTVAPAGSLLSLPFGVLLTGPADPAALATAPWLARGMAIGHLPSAGNLVALRRVAPSQGSRPWFGFGDFRPVTQAQARRSFGPACGDAATLFARLPPLPSAKQELALAARLLGASPQEEMLGAAFTAPAVQRADLSSYRVLHFATHALLPADLKCQTEPALVASAPPGAPDATDALLTASDVARLKLDTDLVILSACNSGGAEGGSGQGSGESLSALARSFFYGGARALLVTHWEVSDQAATYVIADTLRRMKAEPGQDTASALRATQIELLHRAGGSLPAAFAHPFYWAPFALIGRQTEASIVAKTNR